MATFRIAAPLAALLVLAACISDSPSTGKGTSDAGSTEDTGTVVLPDADTKDSSQGNEDAEAGPPPPPGTPLGTVSIDVNGSSVAGFGGPDGTAVQKDGSVVLVGTHADDLVVHGLTSTKVAVGSKSPRNEGYLLVLAPDGTVKWAWGISSANNGATFRAVATDGNGDVFALADFDGTSGVLHRTGTDVPLTAKATGGGEVILKFDGANGALKWSMEISSASSGSGYIGRAISVVDGRILILNNAFRGVLWNGVTTAAGSFVGILDDGVNPTQLGYTVLGTQPADRGMTATLAPDKTPVIAGEFFSTSFNVGGITLNQPSGTLSDGWVAAMAPDLSSAKWAKRLDYSWVNSSNHADYLHVAASSTEVLLSGSVKGQVIYDGTPFLSMGGTQDGFTGNIDLTNGSLKSVPIIGGAAADDWIASADTLPGDVRLVAGVYMSNGIALDSFTFPPPGKSGAFFFKRKAGVFQFGYAAAGPDLEATGIALAEARDHAYAIGAFKGTMKSGGKDYKSEAGGNKLSVFVTNLVP